MSGLLVLLLHSPALTLVHIWDEIVVYCMIQLNKIVTYCMIITIIKTHLRILLFVHLLRAWASVQKLQQFAIFEAALCLLLIIVSTKTSRIISMTPISNRSAISASSSPLLSITVSFTVFGAYLDELILSQTTVVVLVETLKNFSSSLDCLFLSVTL